MDPIGNMMQKPPFDHHHHPNLYHFQRTLYVNNNPDYVTYPINWKSHLAFISILKIVFIFNEQIQLSSKYIQVD